MVDIRSYIEDPAVQIPEQAVTLEGFRSWAKSDDFPQTGRICYIEGEILIAMSPERLESHGKVKEEISYVVGGIVRESDLGEFYLDRTLITNPEADVSNEPDATFISWESLKSGRVRLVSIDAEEDAIEIEGSPDWVLEVVSKSSFRKDTEILRRAYHLAGIKEYWLVDASGKEIEFTILHHRQDGYVPASTHEGWQQSEVFGHRFQLHRVRGRMNRWKYSLRSEPIRPEPDSPHR